MSLSKWTDNFLNGMRQQADPLADNAARAMFARQDHKGIFSELRKMAQNDSIVPADFPPDLKLYFEQTSFPEYSEEDKEKFEISTDIFNRFGYSMVGLLFFKSLPSGYMCPWPAHVLRDTKLLVEQATRRIFETAQFIFDVNMTGWWEPNGKGIRSAQKVRLMHAGIRVMLEEKMDPPWDPVRWGGRPINQEDLVLTLQLFSLACIRGLYNLGIQLSHDEQEAFFHSWKMVGRLMGISRELEPENVSDGWALQKKIFSRLVFLPNDDGPKLAKALIDVLHEKVEDRVSHEAFEKIGIYLMHEHPDAYKSLGFHKPALRERILDKVVFWALNWKIWHYLFHHDHTKKGYIGLIDGFFLKMIHRRLGLQHDQKEDPKTDLMKHLIKTMLGRMAQDPRAFVRTSQSIQIPLDLREQWKLDEYK